MMVSRLCGREDGELVFNRYRISVEEDGWRWQLANKSHVLKAAVLRTAEYNKGLSFMLCVCVTQTSLGAQTVKCLPATWETWVQSRGREDPLEKQMATHSSILAWRILWNEEPGGLQSMGSQRVRHERATSHSLYQNLKKKRMSILQSWKKEEFMTE